jgi:serine/threonine-protein kinase
LEATDALKRFLPRKAPRKKTVAVWKFLLQKKLAEAKAVFDQFPTVLNQENSPLHFPYGAYLYMTEGPEAATRHFSLVLETPYPPTTALPSLFLTNRLKGWMERAFWWEKKELHRQIELFYRCVGKK